MEDRTFPGSPVIRLHTCTAGNAGWIPGQGTKNWYALWCGQKRWRTEAEEDDLPLWIKES